MLWKIDEPEYKDGFKLSGFVPRGESIIVCQSDNAWKPDPSTLVCVEAVALVIGGSHDDGSQCEENRLEVYGPTISMMDFEFSGGTCGQSVFYFGGNLILCGGRPDSQTARSCIMGKWNMEDEGNQYWLENFNFGVEL